MTKIYILLILSLFSRMGFAENVSTPIVGQNTPANVCSVLKAMNNLQNIYFEDYELVSFNETAGEPDMYSLDLKSGRLECYESSSNSVFASIVYDDLSTQVSSSLKTLNLYLYKAQKVKGLLAEELCSALKTFDKIENQTVDVGKQIIFNDNAQTIFGMESEISIDGVLNCGKVDGFIELHIYTK